MGRRPVYLSVAFCVLNALKVTYLHPRVQKFSGVILLEPHLKGREGKEGEGME